MNLKGSRETIKREAPEGAFFSYPPPAPSGGGKLTTIYYLRTENYKLNTILISYFWQILNAIHERPIPSIRTEIRP